MHDKTNCCVVVLLFAATVRPQSDFALSKIRTKRTLVYPPDFNEAKLVIGVGIPANVEDKAVTVGWTVECAYPVVGDSSNFTRPLLRKRNSQTPRLTRYDYYRFFEETLQRLIGVERNCLLKSICEVSATPLLASGLTGQLLHILLTPSSTNDPVVSAGDAEYHKAEAVGKIVKDCNTFYPCASNLLNEYTKIKNTT